MSKCEISGKETNELFECNACGVLFSAECGNTIRLLCEHCIEFAESGRMDEIEEE